MNLFQNVLDHWSEDWKSNRKRFWFELVGTLMSVMGSATMSICAANPPMMTAYIMWFIGSTSMLVGARMRNASWMFLLMFFNTVMNIVGLTILVLS